MPLIVEDGTLPAGANSFASVADADALPCRPADGRMDGRTGGSPEGGCADPRL
ncbi:DnaT-like ssDNA-binding protein [Bilophila wadsworthia]|uniref:DnaT-like ssDNA-binding protein n=1 Tax=Bilophila wadsworthia TaxID=35833 RepID=UPI003521D8E6